MAITKENKTITLRYLLFFLLATISWLAVTPEAPASIETINDKLNHWFAFVVLAAVTDNAYPKSTHWHKWISLLAYAILIEFVQYFLPWRDASIMDIAADISGILSYMLIIVVSAFWLNRSR